MAIDMNELVTRWMSSAALVKNYRAPQLAFARRYTDNKHGHIKRMYRINNVMTPLDKRSNLNEDKSPLREEITLEHLCRPAHALNDLQAAEELNEARAQLFKRASARA